MRARFSGTAAIVAAMCCAMISGCSAPRQGATESSFPDGTSPSATIGPDLTASASAAASRSAATAASLSDPAGLGQAKASEVQSPAGLDPAAPDPEGTDLCALLPVELVAALVPNARQGRGNLGPDSDTCQYGGAAGILGLYAAPAPTSPWLAQVHLEAQQYRDMASPLHGTFEMHGVPGLGSDGESFYERSVSPSDPTVGSSNTMLVWLEGNVKLSLGFIGKPSLPDQTTALLPLARQIAIATASPSFVP